MYLTFLVIKVFLRNLKNDNGNFLECIKLICVICKSLLLIVKVYC